MSNSNEATQVAQKPAQIVYVVLRYGQIFGVYEALQDAQQIQATYIAKGNICDVQAHIVKSKNII